MHDVFRTIPTRFLGHGFAIAAAFGPTIYMETHDLLTTIGTGYIIVHAVHRGLAVGGNATVRMIFDTLIFDCFASALIPTFLTYHMRWLGRNLLIETRTRPTVWRWMPTIISLASLVFTWQHIDRLVDDVMNQSIREL